MSIPKVVGIEQEYAIAIENQRDFDAIELSFLIVNSYGHYSRTIWDYETESPLMDARGFRREGEEASVSAQANYSINNLLPNGARFYVDHAHPEFSTAECLTARDVVAFDKAGELFLLCAMEKASAKLGRGRKVLVFKNNSDQRGNSFGTHENYLVDAKTYTRLFPRYPESPEYMLKLLVPFFVSRQVICGAGKVGSENGVGRVDFQIAQRSDFFETILGGQTTHTRPIINTRDEPHADRSRFRRLHVIVGDGNMSEYAAYLKVGITQIVLRMMEDDALQLDLALEDPVRSIVDISHDVGCKSAVRLKSGKSVTAVQIQKEFAWRAAEYITRFQDDGEGKEIVRKWQQVLDALETDPMQLKGRLDWVTKKWLLERQMGKKGLSWNDARVKRMDILYHDIRRDRGLYYVLEGEGQTERILSGDAEIGRFVEHAPRDTRAYFRSECLARFRDQITYANWDILTFDLGDNRDRKVPLQDPLKGTHAHVHALLEASPTAKKLLENLVEQ
jgi:proteasome accessory factor A